MKQITKIDKLIQNIYFRVGLEMVTSLFFSFLTNFEVNPILLYFIMVVWLEVTYNTYILKINKFKMEI